VLASAYSVEQSFTLTACLVHADHRLWSAGPCSCGAAHSVCGIQFAVLHLCLVGPMTDAPHKSHFLVHDMPVSGSSPIIGQDSFLVVVIVTSYGAFHALSRRTPVVVNHAGTLQWPLTAADYLMYLCIVYTAVCLSTQLSPSLQFISVLVLCLLACHAVADRSVTETCTYDA
jgi:hypothetical protein